MKKLNIKWLVLGLGACVLSLLLLSFFAPDAQVIKRSVTINVPANEVYNYLASLKNFRRWSVWGASDSSARYKDPDTDAVPGAVISWTGNPELAGSGTIAIKSLETGEAVEQRIELTAPQSFVADSYFTIIADGPEECTVNWIFSIPSKKPWNVINLFSNVERQMGPDFEKGLAQLKKQLERK